MDCNIVIDPDRCIGCRTCEAACIEAHEKAGRQAAPRIAVVETRCVSAAVTCHHCEDAPCLRVCPVGVIERIGSAVCVDEQRCIGCKMCAIACPYGAIVPSGTSVAGVAGVAFKTPANPASISPLLDWEVGVATCAVKCDLCTGLSDEPLCVRECPTGALSLVGREALDAFAEARRLRAAEGLGSVSVGDAEGGRPR